MTAEIIKLPHSVVRSAKARASARLPRKSKNGTPEERAAKAAAAAIATGAVLEIRPRSSRERPAPRSSLLKQEFAAKLDQLGPLDRKYIEGYFQALVDQQRGRK